MINLTHTEEKSLLESVMPSKKIYLTEDQYVIFITQSEDFSQPISLDHLLHCIVFCKGLSAKEWGIPDEMITYINPPINKVDMPAMCYTSNELPRFYYILPTIDDDPDLSISRTIICALNNLLTVNLYVLAPQSAISALRPIANDHILFREYTYGFWETLTDCNILIASGSIAINALLNQIPVIVAGSHGFGGLVTDDNIHNFIASGFNGRIGGTANEKIPIASIMYEIQYVLGLQGFSINQPFCLLSKKSIDFLVKAFVENGSEDRINKIVTINKQLSGSLVNKDGFMRLKPFVSSSICTEEGLQNSDNGKLLINIHTNKILAAVGLAEMNIINSCNGMNTIQEILIKNNSFEASEIVDFINELWQAKIILFSR